GGADGLTSHGRGGVHRPDPRLSIDRLEDDRAHCRHAALLDRAAADRRGRACGPRSADADRRRGNAHGAGDAVRTDRTAWDVHLHTATAVLMAPVAIAVAEDMQASPYPLALLVALPAPTAFMPPVSSPVNTLVVAPGHYAFADFVRLGVTFSLIVPGSSASSLCGCCCRSGGTWVFALADPPC